MAVAAISAEAGETQKERRKHDLFPYFLVAPAALLVTGFTVLSLLFTGIASLTNWDVAHRGIQFIGLGNFVRAIHDAEVMGSFTRSAIFVVSVTFISTFAGFLLAVAVNRKVRGKAALRAFIVAPWVISELTTGVFWMILLMPDSPLGQLLGGPLRTSSGAMTSLILVESWRSVGFAMVMALASLQSIDEALHEAARVDGANGWLVIWHITLPLVSPTLLIVAILLMIGNFNLVTIILALTGGGPIDATKTAALHMYEYSFQYFQIGYGSAIAIMMSIVNVIAMGIFVLAQRGRGAHA